MASGVRGGSGHDGVVMAESRRTLIGLRVIRNSVEPKDGGLAGLARAPIALVRRSRPALGTFVDVGAIGRDADAAADAAFEAIALAGARWSFHDPASELSRLNVSPGAWVPVSRATARLLRLARALARASRHRFDCTVAGLLVAAGALPRLDGGAMLARGDAADIEVGLRRARLRSEEHTSE